MAFFSDETVQDPAKNTHFSLSFLLFYVGFFYNAAVMLSNAVMPIGRCCFAATYRRSH